MGIPRFYRWISERYPLVVQPVGEHALPGVDCLYVDVNGVLHSCGHPFSDASKNTASTEEIAAAAFRSLARIVSLARPRKLLYIAVDGVAPRAKMNQQRARRFRAAQGPPGSFDSNAISPGTSFMHAVGEHLRYFVARSQSADPLWAGLSVVLSGPECAGEGEHKIMDYIRRQRTTQEWRPDLCHCLYGADADLIILGLLTHEHNVLILREETLSREALRPSARRDVPLPFQLLHLSLLREYLELEFASAVRHRQQLDVERAVDDFALMMCLIGNDFLPGLPTLEIAEKGLDQMLEVYKLNLEPRLGGYITDGARVDPARLMAFLQLLAAGTDSDLSMPDFAALSLEDDDGAEQEEDPDGKRTVFLRGLDTPLLIEDEEEDAADDICDDMLDEEEADASAAAVFGFGEEPGNGHSLLSQPGAEWRETYYTSKFGPEGSLRNTAFHERLCTSFLDGISWVLRYYNEGCPSWSWYYPYHYAPCISELAHANWRPPTFGPSEPFEPLQQLLAVLPPGSAELVPETFRWLMTDPSSPIADFYPKQFKTDLNGKKNDYEAVVLIPFIDVARLLGSMHAAEELRPLTPHDRARNTVGRDLLFRYFPKSSQRALSSIPTVIPEVYENHSVGVPLERSSKPFVAVPTSQLPRVPRKPLPFIPTLRTLEFSSMTRTVGLRMHMNPSRSPSMVLFVRPVADATIESEAQELVGKTVFVNWPFLWEAKVAGVVDATHSIEYHNGMLVKKPHENAAWWAREVAFQRDEFKTRRAIDIGDVQLLVEVFPLQGIVEHADGSRSKWFGEEPFLVPHQLVVTNPPALDSRWEASMDALPIDKLFPGGTRIINLNAPLAFAVGKVLSADRAHSTLNLALQSPALQPDVASILSDPRALEDVPVGGGRWMKIDDLARGARCSVDCVSKITAKLVVSGTGGRRPDNLGLMLRNNAESTLRLGWCRRHPRYHYWEFSDAALRIVLDYKQLFPQIFDTIERDPNAPSYHISAIQEASSAEAGSGSKEKVVAMVMNVKRWIKQLEFQSSPLVPIGTKVLSRTTIAAIDAAVQHARNAALASKPEERAFRLGKIYGIVRPMQPSPLPLVHQLGQDAITLGAGNAIELGARVMNVMEDGTAPFGALGTVISVKGSVVDVMFDAPFFAGTTLNGLCPDFRGTTRQRNHLLLVPTGSMQLCVTRPPAMHLHGKPQSLGVHPAAAAATAAQPQQQMLHSKHSLDSKIQSRKQPPQQRQRSPPPVQTQEQQQGQVTRTGLHIKRSSDAPLVQQQQPAQFPTEQQQQQEAKKTRNRKKPKKQQPQAFPAPGVVAPPEFPEYQHAPAPAPPTEPLQPQQQPEAPAAAGLTWQQQELLQCRLHRH